MQDPNSNTARESAVPLQRRPSPVRDPLDDIDYDLDYELERELDDHGD